jgi:hypothetical protein
MAGHVGRVVHALGPIAANGAKSRSALTDPRAQADLARLPSPPCRRHSGKAKQIPASSSRPNRRIIPTPQHRARKSYHDTTRPLRPSHWQEGGTCSSLPRDQLAGGDGVHLAEPPAIPRPRRPPPPPPPAVARVRHGGVPPPRRPPQARPRHPPRPMVQPGTRVPSSPVSRLERRWPDACALCCCCLCTLQGTAFSMTERDRLGLRGLLPPSVVSSQQQIDRFSTTPPIPRLLLCVSLVCCCPKLDCSVLRREVFWLTMTRSFHF